MRKLQLEHITKTYKSGELVTALNDVSLTFRENEFVAVLGPSGCGKTTLLNVVGGLDRYDSGDLIIDGTSTSQFRDSDWDAYRNHSIGFVFQNYNLIGHQTVLQNVEIALTLSGVSASDRDHLAKQALAEVGLSDQLEKKPSQLSGGQMQRVAIARALVNNPDVILADEPTGALDSHTSTQIMEILKEISKTRLVIMVTHNSKLADRYANRVIQLLDGAVESDSNPPEEYHSATDVQNDKSRFKKTSMSFATATGLSFKNLLTKRGRTITTSIAGSFGIIGIAVVLALSSGLSAYMASMQTDMLSGFPIMISTQTQRFDRGIEGFFGSGSGSYVSYPTDDIIYNYNSNENQREHTNVLSDDYLAYIAKMTDALPNAVSAITYQRGVTMNLLAKTSDSVVRFETRGSGGGGMAGMGGGSYWQEMPENYDFILSLYDLIGEGSRLPNAKNEIVLVVDEYNRINTNLLNQFGLDKKTYKLSDFIGKTMLKVIDNDDYYTKNGDLFEAARPAEYLSLYEGSGGVELTIVGILRIKEDAASSYFSQGFVYTTALTAYVVDSAKNSEIARAQKTSDKDVLTGMPFADENAKKTRLRSTGADTTPSGINIYPVDFAAKDSIKAYLDDYNEGKPEASRVVYTDMAESISDMTATLVNTVSLVLIGFAAISLLVSTIMIGIITYVSVIERTKEIGILRSVGARKKDISRVFNAEAMIIGLLAGIIGVATTYLVSIPGNMLIVSIAGISTIIALNPLHALILVVGSVILTLIASFFPSRGAAKKNPVEALRSE